MATNRRLSKTFKNHFQSICFVSICEELRLRCNWFCKSSISEQSWLIRAILQTAFYCISRQTNQFKTWKSKQEIPLYQSLLNKCYFYFRIKWEAKKLVIEVCQKSKQLSFKLTHESISKPLQAKRRIVGGSVNKHTR